MEDKSKWNFTKLEKDEFIDALTEELSVLRAKAGVSQDELARVIGISRQTYGAIERKTRRMSWNTYLSLILFFDYTESTHKMIRDIKTIPSNFFSKDNKKEDVEDDSYNIITKEINQKLDERAMHAIKTVVMMEYARCSDLPNDILINTFGGKIVKNSKERNDN